MFAIRVAVLVPIVFAVAARVLGAPPPALVELQVGEKKYEGKLIASNPAGYWLVGQEGRLSVFDAKTVTKTRQISPEFRGWNSSLVKDQLQREFSRPYDVASTRHYVVVASSGAKARRYADMLEDFFGTFRMYFSLRGFEVPEPEFPLVSIVFPSQEAFGKYAASERQRVSQMVRGYYMPTSNRIAFFETSGDQLSLLQPNDPWPGLDRREAPASEESRLAFESTLAPVRLIEPTAPLDSVEGSLEHTMIHEGTHQAAYNTGLHSRIGANPLWMVEGLATVFEAPGVRNSRANSGVKSRINADRLIWFGIFAKERRKPKSLETFLAGDDLFRTNPLDAYSQAWALTFYLFETRPREYAQYLRTVAARNPLEEYTPQARVADFQRTISKDLKVFEAEFLRFIAGIK